jgi:predicted alpha/beta-fold hydrolase
MPSDIPDFVPHRWLRNGHTMTIVSAFLRRKFRLPEPEQRLFRVDPYSQLLALCNWQEGRRRDVPVIAIVHGLEGSADSNYVRGIAEKAWERGFHVVRLNQRNCGGSEKLTPTLYNSGMSGDYACVLDELAKVDGFEKIFFVGYSMGGNLVTKMAGEFGEEYPRALRGVCTVCPSIDLSACADALELRENYLYQRHFVKGLVARYTRMPHGATVRRRDHRAGIWVPRCSGILRGGGGEASDQSHPRADVVDYSGRRPVCAIRDVPRGARGEKSGDSICAHAVWRALRIHFEHAGR